MHSRELVGPALFFVAMLLISCGSETSTSTKSTVQFLTVSPASISIAVGQTQQYTADVRYRNGTSERQAHVEWATSDASMATADSTGSVTAAKPGKVAITATVETSSGWITGSTELTIILPNSELPAIPRTITQSGAVPLFTEFPSPLICADSSYVAFASVRHPIQLTIIRIGPTGIEQPRKISVETDVYGMKCNYQRVELLIEGQNEDFFSRLPFSIREDAIEREKPIPINYSISGKGPMPIEIEDFHKIQARQLGDWYVGIPAYPKVNTAYELHYVSTLERSSEALKTKLVVDLLEETLDRTVTKTMPLVRVENSEGGE